MQDKGGIVWSRVDVKSGTVKVRADGEGDSGNGDGGVVRVMGDGEGDGGW